MKKYLFAVMILLLLVSISYAQTREDRVQYAASYEEFALGMGMDVVAKAMDKGGTTFYLQFVMINRPFVYNFMNERSNTRILKEKGFKRVHFTDGFGNSWTVKVP